MPLKTQGVVKYSLLITPQHCPSFFVSLYPVSTGVNNSFIKLFFIAQFERAICFLLEFNGYSLEGELSLQVSFVPGNLIIRRGLYFYDLSSVLFEEPLIGPSGFVVVYIWEVK